MKSAPFAYVRPSTLDDVLAELSRDEDAKVLAGGQSLVPVLAMRLGRPTTLVDLTAVPELAELSRVGSRPGPGARGPVGAAAPRVAELGSLRIGAAARQRSVERSPLSGAVPLLGRALPFVGHRELRSRGTVCGSLAHADPAAELPAVAACLGGTVEIAGPSGRRRVAADAFVSGAMTTLAGPDEVVTAVELPVAGPGEGYGFAEIARRHGDFALAGVVTVVRVDASGALVSARLTGFGVSDRPVTVDATDALRSALDGHVPGVVGAGPVGDRPVRSTAARPPDGREPGGDGLARRLRAATGELADHMADAEGDAHGSTGYRRRLLAVLAARELAAALDHARRGAGGGPGAGARGADARPDGAGRRAAGSVRGAARPVAEIAPGVPADVTLTVNGTATTVSVPPRMHLADALRERIGLTGTHLGCEHGVCGMCTVLVDGDAARACLLFAVQCDGADVVTVEGLGSADDQHPLQRAFSHHHGLQCGFCTPGMLMSGYDLLRHDPSVGPDALPEQMSGVLCRCTGYRGILAAVADVAAAYPGGVPGPLACGRRAVVGRSVAVPEASGDRDTAGADVAVRPGSAVLAEAGPDGHVTPPPESRSAVPGRFPGVLDGAAGVLRAAARRARTVVTDRRRRRRRD